MRCVALLSGGLDSQLVVRLMQEQGVAVEAINVRTTFECCQNQAGRVAQQLGIPLTVVAPDPDYLNLIREPQFGYGRGANPCVDCRIYMFQRALSFMRQVDAQFVVSGEVIGQRPMSQKRTDLEIIAHHSGLRDLLLRPLSAKLMSPTTPEQNGWVDRNLLHGFCGRGRRGLIALAHQLGLEEIPMPSTGCALTEKAFSRKVFDLIDHKSDNCPWDFELLKHGRHFRLDGRCKIVVGRHETENVLLEHLHQLPDATSTALMVPDGFRGPAALIIGSATDEAMRYGGALILRYSKSSPQSVNRVKVLIGATTHSIDASIDTKADQARTLAMPRA